MKKVIKLEEVAMFGLSVLMFAQTGFTWWLPALLLVPDISIIGYGISDRLGALLYNLCHHKGTAFVVYAAGYLAEERYFQLAGAILFGRSSMDRIFGYDLKYANSFNRTHLGRIGQK